MKENKTSDAQLKAIQRWREGNKKANRIQSYKSTARTFFRHYADDDDIQELLEIYKKENPNSKK